MISETQYNYAIPDESVRPTSPVQRLLERWHTQPNMSYQGPPPGSQMDPITRQYYHRLWKSQIPTTSEMYVDNNVYITIHSLLNQNESLALLKLRHSMI